MPLWRGSAEVIRLLVCALLAVCGGMLVVSFPKRSRPSQAGVLLVTFAAVSAVFSRW